MIVPGKRLFTNVGDEEGLNILHNRVFRISFLQTKSFVRIFNINVYYHITTRRSDWLLLATRFIICMILARFLRTMSD